MDSKAFLSTNMHMEQASDEASSTYSATVGYAGVAVAVVFFGSNFVPVKKFEVGDGEFVVLYVCVRPNINACLTLLILKYHLF